MISLQYAITVSLVREMQLVKKKKNRNIEAKKGRTRGRLILSNSFHAHVRDGKMEKQRGWSAHPGLYWERF